MHRSVIFTVTADGAALGFNPRVTAASVEDGCKVLWLIGKIRI